jgi:hypothetical protein
MKTLITNGQIITATDNYKADIFIDGETITHDRRKAGEWKPT